MQVLKEEAEEVKAELRSQVDVIQCRKHGTNSCTPHVLSFACLKDASKIDVT